MSTLQNVHDIVDKTKSIDCLFKFFCNNLYLGQWQLAKTSLQQLCKEDSQLPFPITDFLRDVSSYPFNRRCVTKGIERINYVPPIQIVPPPKSRQQINLILSYTKDNFLKKILTPFLICTCGAIVWDAVLLPID